MSGHSHWAQVKHKKAVVDVKRGQLMSKLLRVITIAAREGSNPETNYKLRAAIERAKSFQVPLENIERAIKKVETESQNLEEVIFEAYLDEVQILIKGITDNKNRTLGELKSVLNKYDAKLAEPGAVKWNFQEKIKIIVDKNKEENIFKFLDLFEDIQENNNEIILIANPEKIDQIKKMLQNEQINVREYLYELKPMTMMENLSENLKEKLDKLIEDLLDLDDIEEVYTNT